MKFLVLMLTFLSAIAYGFATEAQEVQNPKATDLTYGQPATVLIKGELWPVAVCGENTVTVQLPVIPEGKTMWVSQTRQLFELNDQTRPTDGVALYNCISATPEQKQKAIAAGASYWNSLKTQTCAYKEGMSYFNTAPYSCNGHSFGEYCESYNWVTGLRKGHCEMTGTSDSSGSPNCACRR